MESQLGQRLEAILIALAQQYAPALAQTWARQGDYSQRLPLWARQLANYNLLVLMGDFSDSLASVGQDAPTMIQAWVTGYGNFYHLLARALFPSYAHLSAHYTDDKWPVVIYMQGAATPVITLMAGYVAPFVVRRQLEREVSEAELVGLMDLILDELDANLPREAYKQLRAEGVHLLKTLLAMQIRQLSLTEFDQPIITDSQRLYPVKIDLLAEPPLLPEEDSQITQTDVRAMPPERAAYTPHRADTQTLGATQSMRPETPPRPPEAPSQQANSEGEADRPFGASLPIFSRSIRSGRKERGGRRPMPPVPPLPKDKDKP